MRRFDGKLYGGPGWRSPRDFAKLRTLALLSRGRIIKCTRCGYRKNWRALVFDHKHGDGAEARRKGNHDFAAFRRNPKGIQILCANCNLIKAVERGEFTRRRGR